MRDAWRLSVGTLTAVRVAAPVHVDRRTAGRAMLLAPLAVLPLGLLVAAVVWLGSCADAPPLVVAFVAIGALAAGSRALHWDGLSDTVDGLTASYDAERSLTVMRSGTSGPAGVVATVVVLGVQVSALAALVGSPQDAVLAGFLVCASRSALTITCMSGVPAARAEGLGRPHAGTVPLGWAVASWILVASVTTGLVLWSGGDWWRALVAVLLSLLVVALLVRRSVRRFGGVTGDVYGAAVELGLATMLAVLA